MTYLQAQLSAIKTASTSHISLHPGPSPLSSSTFSSKKPPTSQNHPKTPPFSAFSQPSLYIHSSTRHHSSTLARPSFIQTTYPAQAVTAHPPTISSRLTPHMHNNSTASRSRLLDHSSQRKHQTFSPGTKPEQQSTREASKYARGNRYRACRHIQRPGQH